jgi:hypothetical protein
MACLWLGKERDRTRVWRRLLRSSLLYSRPVALAVTVLFLLGLQAHLGKIAGCEVTDAAPEVSTRDETELVSGRSARHLTSSMHSADSLLGVVTRGIRTGMATAQKVPPRTLSPIPTRQLRVADHSRTLRFVTCNGFANQRLSLAYGIILAKVTNRVPVLPDFLLNGRQSSDAWITDLGSNASLPMAAMYDVEAFGKGMASRAGMEVLSPQEAPPVSEYVRLSLDGVADIVHHMEA